MAELVQDIYDAHSPLAFVYIGGVLCPAIHYETNMVAKENEASTCKVLINLDDIDTSILTEDTVTKNVVEVQVWVGYITDNSDAESQIKELREAIEHGKSQRKFRKRFDGYISQPEFVHGFEETLSLDCSDWVAFLKDYKYYHDFKDNDTEAKSVFNVIKRDIKGLEFVMDSYNGSKRLGELNGSAKNYVYHSQGRSYWDILEDIAKRTSMRIIVDHKKIHLTRYKKSPFIWPLYYGPANKQKKEGVQVGQYFEKATIRYGQKFRVDKSNVVIDVYGENHTKKGKDRKVYVRFPEHSDIIPGITDFHEIHVPGDIRIEGAKILAEDKYRELSKRLITATVELPFANNFMDLWDIIEFKPDESMTNLQYLNDVWFSINCIHETFSVDGYKQTIEADSDPELHKTFQKKVSPGDKKSSNKRI